MSGIRELRVVLEPNKNVLRMLNGNTKKVRGRPRKIKSPIMFQGTEDIKKEKTDDIVVNKEVITINRFVPKRRTRAAIKAVPDLFPPEVLKLPENRRKRRRLIKTEDAVYNGELEMKKELIENGKENDEEENHEEIPLFKKKRPNPKSNDGPISPKMTSLKQQKPAERAENDSEDLTPINGGINGSLASETDEDFINADYSSIYTDSQTPTSAQVHKSRLDTLITLKKSLAVVLDESREKSHNPEEQKQKSFEDLLDSSTSSSTVGSPVPGEGDQDIHELYFNTGTKEGTEVEIPLNAEQIKAKKMKCLNEILAETFDQKLPGWEEKVYLLVKEALNYQTREEARRYAERMAQEKMFENMVLSDLQEIKLAVQELRGRSEMIEMATQTMEVQQFEENSFSRGLDQMIVLDSVGETPDKQSSVFKRLGRREQELLDVDGGLEAKKLSESPRNPAPEALSSIDFQREMIERENRRCNILMKGIRLSRRNRVDDVDNFIWKQMNICASVVRVMMLGEQLVVTVGSAGIKEWIIRKRGMLKHSGVIVDVDYTGREKKVQMWLENEAKRRSRGGRVLQVGYQKIKIDGCWWYWNELEGRLNRNQFRTDVISISRKNTNSQMSAILSFMF